MAPNHLSLTRTRPAVTPSQKSQSDVETIAAANGTSAATPATGSQTSPATPGLPDAGTIAASTGPETRRAHPHGTTPDIETPALAGRPNPMNLTAGSHLAGTVVIKNQRHWVKPLLAQNDASKLIALRGANLPAEGTVVQGIISIRGNERRLDLTNVLAEAESPRAKLYAIAGRHQMDPTYPPEVLAEVEAIVKSPGIDDPKLVDLTDKAFITIDNKSSRDLDQAMHIEKRTDGGYDIFYALADASYYVKPGTALFDEALKRASSYYFPGFAISMLPEKLSEDIVSLNPGVGRRSLVMKMSLSADGKDVDTELFRGRIRSRQKLTYDGVQAMHDNPQGHALSGQEFTTTLNLLKEVGLKRMALADERNVVRYQRTPVKVAIEGRGEHATFELMADTRNEVEKWNEQVSLLCNIEGAKFLIGKNRKNLTSPDLQPIFRAHESPPESRRQEFSAFVDTLVTKRKLDPKVWLQTKKESLADYLARLPSTGPNRGTTLAIHRRAMLINVRSNFQVAPEGHHGIGATAYARFSSPMREMVGIFTHKEAIEIIDGKGADRATDLALQARVIDAGNGAKSRQNKVTKEANKLAIDAVFSKHLDVPRAQRQSVSGTFMGAERGRAYVLLDDPPIEVKVYLSDLKSATQKKYTIDSEGVTLTDPGGESFVVGEPVDLTLLDYNQTKDRWVFDLG